MHITYIKYTQIKWQRWCSATKCTETKQWLLNLRWCSFSYSPLRHYFFHFTFFFLSVCYLFEYKQWTHTRNIDDRAIGFILSSEYTLQPLLVQWTNKENKTVIEMIVFDSRKLRRRSLKKGPITALFNAPHI